MLKAMLVVVPPLLIASAAALAQPAATPPRLDLKKASIVVDKAEALHLKAAEYLQVEVARRCGVRLAVSAKAPGAVTVPLLYMDTADHALPGAAEPPQALTLPEQPEAYSLWSIDDQRVHLRGSDARGLLFGAGKLVQVLALAPDEIYLETPLALLAAPKYPIRAHQLGYRNTANTYDMWDVETFDQYIRDLIAFGTNGIELIPALEEGQQDSPVMRENMWDMTLALCDTISDYGVDVWMWSSADEDLSKPEEYAKALERRKHLFESCKRIDAFFVPGGDDGDNLAQYLMPWMKDVAKALKEAQPHATLWVSNQTFTDEENDYLFNLLQNEKPDWLKGVIYGPWTEMTLAELRDRTPEQYLVRRYPDITHLVRCQYPVDDWDPAFAHLLNREAICPRPRAIAHIHNLYAPHASGFGTYSDGVHDDLNKFVWSALGWNPEEPIERIVQAYADLFFGDAQAEAGAAALFALEENW
ncbi:MAG: hypothetical protein HYZ00_04950, partial [Candidatus Hydrogenedentes bacterium]|nr:hypothetical protein [Candidatus Hydrogenedentota bacterium]